MRENVRVWLVLLGRRDESMQYVNLYHFIQNESTILVSNFSTKFEWVILLRIQDFLRSPSNCVIWYWDTNKYQSPHSWITRTKYHQMHNATKILIALAGLALIWATTYSISSQNPKAPTLDSLRTQAQEARQREERARIDREIWEDNLSKALYDSCYSQSTSGTGVRFDSQVRVAYECWKSEKINNSWTVASAISGVFPKWINAKQNASVAIHIPSNTIGLKDAEHSTAHSAKKNDPKKLSDKSNYWQAYSVAIAQIHKWEGLRLSAYWDHAGYSIGYGSRAKSSKEKITKAEADRRLTAIVKQVLSRVQNDFPKLRREAQGALVSFAYNCHKWYQSVRKNGLQYHGQWCKTASGKRLSGLVNRRAEESRLIFSK